MAVGLSATVANSILDALCRGVTWTPPAALWVQPHIGSPGAAGTSNQAVNTTRKQAVFATPAASGSITNTSAMTWTLVPATEQYTFCSVWDASVGGNFQFAAALASDAPVGAGGTYTIPIGGLIVPITSLAA